MQVGSVTKFLSLFAGVLGRSGATGMAGALSKAVDALAPAEALTTARLLQKLDTYAPAASMGNNDAVKLGDIIPALEGLTNILSEGGGKRQLVVDIELLLDLTNRHREMSVDEFRNWVVLASASRSQAGAGAATMEDKQLVENYLERLTAALGNDAVFRSVFNELCADTKVTRGNAIEIATRFIQPMPPSTTRPKALQKILQRHEKLMGNRDRGSSIGGKAA